MDVMYTDLYFIVEATIDMLNLLRAWRLAILHNVSELSRNVNNKVIIPECFDPKIFFSWLQLNINRKHNPQTCVCIIRERVEYWSQGTKRLIMIAWMVDYGRAGMVELWYS